MKPVFIWCGLSGAILLAALFFKNLPNGWQGPAFTGVLFIVTLGLIVRICRSSE